MNTKQRLSILSLLLSGLLLFTACTPQAATKMASNNIEHTQQENHMRSMGGHMSGMHQDVPADLAATPNPIEANEESIAIGANIYATSCAVCHGENGEGDGVGGAGLAIKPSNLHENHVQGLSDGALFYVLSQGKPENAMPAWENILSEEDRWHLINYLRTFEN